MSHDTPSPQAQGAHKIITLLRSTVATQKLPYQHGTEGAALDSLYKQVFLPAREVMEAHPDATLATKISEMLNGTLRPFMARWHRRKESGGLGSRDGGDAFRGELADLQEQLRGYAREFHRMAYGSEWREENDAVPAALNADDLAFLSHPLAYGIPEDAEVNGGVPEEIARNINEAERQEIESRREKTGAGGIEGRDAVGLAFSGGGIRSATFCLGVAQVLADKGLVRDVDYLSTVSGGGYVGGFLARRLGEGTPQRDLGGAQGPDPRAIQYLRLRAKYLAAKSLWDAWGMVFSTVAGMLMNWMVPLLVVTIAAWATMQVKLPADGESGWLPAVTIMLGVTSLLTLGFFFMLRASVQAARTTGALAGIAAGLTVLLLPAWWIDLGFDQVFAHTDRPWDNWQDLVQGLKESPVGLWISGSTTGAGLTATVAGIAAMTPVVLRFVPVLRSPKGRRIVNLLCLWIAGIVLPLLGVAVFYLLCAVGRVRNAVTLPEGISFVGGLPISGTQLLATAIVLLGLLAVFFLDINLTAPFRLYRNGLRKTFVDDRDGPEQRVGLDSLNRTGMGPYHLINCTANLPSSDSIKLSERKSDFFLFSKFWAGSPVVGYRPTETWRMNGKVPDLASAIAISGAAFSSHMGLGSIPPLRALLTFLNVRLGYWIPKPGDRPLRFKHPGFSCLLREMTALRMSEKQRWLNLSDGGHIENLATYELLRRRCKFILCVDGEADPDLTFHGFMTLIRHAQIDLGVRIDADLDDLRGDPATGYSRSHYQLCRIHYPGGGTGLLLYLKLSVTGNECELIRRYRGTCPEFPHQTTLDQFFDEEQFEAYRQLGAHVAEGLFAPCLMGGKEHPENIPEWFSRLAGNLLEKETGND